MIQHPFLDFKNLSDDELLNKAMEIQKKLLKAHMWGSSQDIIGQLTWMMEMIEEEKGERLFKQQHEQFNSMFPEKVESDPTFQQAQVEVKEKSKTDKPLAAPKRVSSFPATFDKEYIIPEVKPARKPDSSSE